MRALAVSKKVTCYPIKNESMKVLIYTKDAKRSVVQLADIRPLPQGLMALYVGDYHLSSVAASGETRRPARRPTRPTSRQKRGRSKEATNDKGTGEQRRSGSSRANDMDDNLNPDDGEGHKRSDDMTQSGAAKRLKGNGQRPTRIVPQATPPRGEKPRLWRERGYNNNRDGRRDSSAGISGDSNSGR